MAIKVVKKDNSPASGMPTNPHDEIKVSLSVRVQPVEYQHIDAGIELKVVDGSTEQEVMDRVITSLKSFVKQAYDDFWGGDNETAELDDDSLFDSVEVETDKIPSGVETKEGSEPKTKGEKKSVKKKDDSEELDIFDDDELSSVDETPPEEDDGVKGSSSDDDDDEFDELDEMFNS